MGVLRRTELLKIFYAVAKNMTEEEFNWLKKDVPAIWEKFTHLEGPDGSFSSWEIDNLYNVYAISFRTQEVVDAKVGRRVMSERIFGDGLPKVYLVEIAKLMGIVSKDIDSEAVKTNKWQLAKEILEKC